MSAANVCVSMCMWPSLSGAAFWHTPSMLQGCTGAHIVPSMSKSGLCEPTCECEPKACMLACLAYVNVGCMCLQPTHLIAACNSHAGGGGSLHSAPADLLV